jgi:hypothetical protein
MGDEWKRWMLPLKGGEIIDIAKENGVSLKGKAITDTTFKLITAYQNGEINTSSSLNKSKELAKQYLIELLLKDKQLSESIRVSLIQERIKNILEKMHEFND